MSHTMTVDGWKLHFNSDYSGLITIVSPDGKDSIAVPFSALAEFVGSALLDKETAALESMTGSEYLKKRLDRS